MNGDCDRPIDCIDLAFIVWRRVYTEDDCADRYHAGRMYPVENTAVILRVAFYDAAHEVDSEGDCDSLIGPSRSQANTIQALQRYLCS